MSEFLVTPEDDVVKQERENLPDFKYEVNVLENIKTEDVYSEDDKFQLDDKEGVKLESSCESVTANIDVLKMEHENDLLDTKYEISYLEDSIKTEDISSEDEKFQLDNESVKLESSSSGSVTANTDVLKKEQENDLMDDEYEISSLEDNIKTEDMCSEDEKFQLDNESVKLESSSSESDTEKVKKRPKPKKRYRKQAFQCDKCNETIVSRPNYIQHCLVRHDMKVKEIKSYICDLCPRRFLNSSSFYYHTKYHAGVRSNVCTYCGKGFITKSCLDIHEKRHLNTKEYACDQCKKRFNTLSGIRGHKLMVHTDRSKWKYLCEICNKPFPVKSNLDSHRRRHIGDKKFECDMCQKRFVDKWALERHMNSHNSVKEFKCTCCEKEYKRKRDMKIHMAKLHSIGVGDFKLPSKERRFVCHLCPKAFCRRHQLTTHLYTHSSEKPFACTICDTKFSYKDNIKRHMIRHIKTRPLK